MSSVEDELTQLLNNYSVTQLHIAHLQDNSMQAYLLVNHLSGAFLLILAFTGVDVLDIKADPLKVADSEVLPSAGHDFPFVPPHEQDFLTPKQNHSCHLGAYQHQSTLLKHGEGHKITLKCACAS